MPCMGCAVLSPPLPGHGGILLRSPRENFRWLPRPSVQPPAPHLRRSLRPSPISELLRKLDPRETGGDTKREPEPTPPEL